MSAKPNGFCLADDLIDVAETIRWEHCAPSNPKGWLSDQIPQGGIVPWHHKLNAAGRAIEDWLWPHVGAETAHALVSGINYRVRELTHQATRIHDNPQNHDVLMPEFRRVFDRCDLDLCYRDLLRHIPGDADLIDQFIHHVGSYIQWDQPPLKPKPPNGLRFDDSYDRTADIVIPGATRTLLHPFFDSETPEGKAYMQALDDHHSRQIHTSRKIDWYADRLAAVLVAQNRDATGVIDVKYCMLEGGGPSNVVTIWGELRAKLVQIAIELRAGALTARKPARAGSNVDNTCPVTLGNPTDAPIVLGKPKKHLSEAQYRVIKKLVDKYPAGLTKDALELDDGAARRTLNNLRADPDWAAILPKPERPGQGGYRIAWPK